MLSDLPTEQKIQASNKFKFMFTIEENKSLIIYNKPNQIDLICIIFHVQIFLID